MNQNIERATPTKNQNIDRIEEIFSNHTVNFKHNEEISLSLDKNNVTGIVDMVIEDKERDSKLYVIVKGSDTLPASIVDVTMLKCIRNKNRNDGQVQHRYVIFCDKEGNEYTKKVSKHYGINYINNHENLKIGLQGYFDDV